MSTSATRITTNRSPAELLAVRGVMELLLASVAFILYAGTLAFGFIYDDRAVVLNNPIITSWSYLPGYFTKNVWGMIDPHMAPNYYRPIFLVWCKINYALFTLAPWGWHLTTVLMHVIVTVQVFWLGQRILKNRTAAAIAALLFAVHPVHVESVAWVCGVTDPLMCAMLLGSVLAFLRWQQTRNIGSYVAALVFASLAFLSKEPAVVLPVLVVVSAWAVTARGDKLSSSDRLGLVPFFVLAVVYLGLRQHVLHGFAHNQTNASIREMVLTWPAVIVFYLRQLFLPYEISLFHDIPWVESIASARFLVPLGILAAVTYGIVYAVRVSKDRRPLVAALVWIAIPLSPMMYSRVFLRGEIVHDRYAYVSSIGFVFLLVLGAQIMMESLPQDVRFSRARAVAIAFAAVFALLTFYNQSDWASDLLLYTHALKVTPNSEAALLNLGSVYVDKGDPRSLEFAKTLFVKAAAVSPQNSAAYFNLGHVQFMEGNYPESEKNLFRAVQLNPGFASWWMHFAGVELRLSKLPEAEAAAREAIRISPVAPGYHAALGAILLNAGHKASAAGEFRTELTLYPDNLEAREGLAQIAKSSTPPASPASATH